MIPALLLTLALGQTPGAEVSLEARPIEIPQLPASLEEARSKGSRVRRSILAAHQEAERYLEACSADLAALAPAEGALVLRPENAAEARVLASYVYDERFLNLEAPLLDRWNAWQTALLSAAMADPAEADRVSAGMRLLSSSKTEVRDRALAGERPLEITWEGGALRLPRRVTWIEVMALERFPYGAHTAFGKRTSALANEQAPPMAEGWAALTRHLNTGAAALLDLDRTAQPTADAGLKALRLMARIAFMERFRSTLWFCQVVWAHMASDRIQSLQQM